MISFDPTDDEKAIRDEVRRFAEQELRKRGRDCERSRAAPDSLRDTYAALGLATIDWPEEHGGAALGPVARAIVDEELAYGDAGLAIALDGPGPAARAILELASPEQRGRYLPILAAPRAVGALALAERDLGSELGHVAATAVPGAADGTCVLNGRKRFVMNAALADLFVVFAKLTGSTGAEPVLRAFVVEKGRAGLSLGREDDRIGLQAVRSCDLALDDVEVSSAAMLAGGEGGFEAGFERLLAHVWITTAARQVGVARAAVDYAVFYAQDRVAFGRKIGSFQGIAFKIADMATETDAARWLVWRAAANLARGRAQAPREAALACIHANDVAVRAATDCVQVLGGAGFVEDYLAEKWMREARALAMFGGNDPARVHFAAEREYGPAEGGGPAPDPVQAFAAFGQAFGG